MTVERTVQNLDSLLTKLSGLRVKYAKGFEVGVKKAALMLLRWSQQIVPVDTGTLKNSGRVMFEGKGFDTEGRVVYGTNYAIYVHEDLTKAHGPGKSAKFIEIPLRKNWKALQDIILKSAKQI